VHSVIIVVVVVFVVVAFAVAVQCCVRNRKRLEMFLYSG